MNALGQSCIRLHRLDPLTRPALSSRVQAGLDRSNRIKIDSYYISYYTRR